MGLYHSQQQADILRAVDVRLVAENEMDRWLQVMRQHHYLGFNGCSGERLFYVATIGTEWVGLLGWNTGALKVGVRDTWIGWDSLVRKKRLKLIANNWRFLILGPRVKNLASRILALNIKQLSGDWQQRYDHPILMVETFVDPSKFSGTCYLAAGWTKLGRTKGYSCKRGVYTRNDRPKEILVRPLHRTSRTLLADPYFSTSKRGLERRFMMDVSCLPIEGEDGLVDVLRTVRDGRSRQGRRHPQVAVLGISTCAMLSGAKSFAAIADWAKTLSPKQLQKFRVRERNPPSQSTFERVLRGLDASEFDTKVNAWMRRRVKNFGRGIAIDGKTLRGSHDGEQKPIHLLSALLHEERVVLAQRDVDAKTNEIKEAIPLLKNIDIEGMVITADAMHCQKEFARFIVEEKKANFVFTLKENQLHLCEAVKMIFDITKPSPESRCYMETDDHGRLEKRTLSVSSIPPSDLIETDFPCISQIFQVHREFTDKSKGKTSFETAVGITSLTRESTAEDILMLLREHWLIENALHYVRDETLGEERSRIRKKSGPRVMATLRNATIGIIRLGGGERIAAELRQFAWNGRRLPMRAVGILN